MNKLADICVIIPCHSYPELFMDAFYSILRQTVKPRIVFCALDDVRFAPRRFHIHMLDYSNTGPEIKHIEEKYGILVRTHSVTDNWRQDGSRSIGIPAVLNRSIRTCDSGKWRTEWFFRLDEDDTLHPQCFERLLLSAELCPERDIHYSDYVRFGDWHGYEALPEYNYERLLQGPYIPSAALIRRNVWSGLNAKNKGRGGFDVNMKHGWEDYLFYLEAGALNIRAARVGLGLLNYRKHGESMSTIADTHTAENIAYMRKKLHDMYGVELCIGKK